MQFGKWWIGNARVSVDAVPCNLYCVEVPYILGLVAANGETFQEGLELFPSALVKFKRGIVREEAITGAIDYFLVYPQIGLRRVVGGARRPLQNPHASQCIPKTGLYAQRPHQKGCHSQDRIHAACPDLRFQQRDGSHRYPPL